MDHIVLIIKTLYAIYLVQYLLWSQCPKKRLDILCVLCSEQVVSLNLVLYSMCGFY